MLLRVLLSLWMMISFVVSVPGMFLWNHDEERDLS